jgi:hypothetical protein
MKNHDVKIQSDFFKPIFDGRKTHLILPNTGDFSAGDTLTIRETRTSALEIQNGFPVEYTGQVAMREVTHIYTGEGLLEGWCSLSYRLSLTELVEEPDFFNHIGQALMSTSATPGSSKIPPKAGEK